MRQSRRRTTPVVYTQPKTTVISEAAVIALLRDQIDRLTEADIHHHHYPAGTSAPGVGVIQGVDGRPLSTGATPPAGAAPAASAPAATNSTWKLIAKKLGIETAEKLLGFAGRILPKLIPALAAGIYGPLAAKRWHAGDKEGAFLAAAQVAGGVIALIPFVGLPTSWAITAMVLAWETMRDTPEGRKIEAQADQAAAAGPSGAGPSGAGPSGAGPSGAGPSGAGPSGATPAGPTRTRSTETPPEPPPPPPSSSGRNYDSMSIEDLLRLVRRS
jgi:hypothetical protein